MFEKYLTRRKFLKYGKLSFIFLLNSCSNVSKKIRISFQSSFYPDSIKDTFPASWQKVKINFEKVKLENKINLLNSDFTLINDGWIDSINFENYQNINYLFSNDKLDNRSRDFLNNFEENQKNKLFPIGVVPYAVIIKNNKDLIYDAKESWDFLLYEKLKGKIIFPKSPRIIISIAKRISGNNALGKLKSQVKLYDDKNALNWLINSDSSLAILPYSLCSKYLKIDSRLSIVFPNKGVPLMWNFILSKSKTNNKLLIEWINSLESRAVIDKLANQGWYLPFQNKYVVSKYNSMKSKINISNPSEICWENSWSFPPLNSKKKTILENFWNESLAP